ncbi:hypothetical protein H0H87_012445 [Tephrocybe sp. NHM501043]|nr:hypothetical protein H0H87_012445 [Tephrocybe sp. NHM501043]
MSLSTRLLRLASLRAITRATPRALAAARPNSTLATDVASTLVDRLRSNSPLSAIHMYYPALVAELQKTATTSSGRPPPSLTRDQLFELLDVLATSGRPADLQRIEEILNHMPTMFGINVTEEVYTVIIRGLIKHRNDHTIYRWLHSMPSRAVPLNPTHEQWHMFLKACLELSPFKYVRHVIGTMRQTGCNPNNETFKYLVLSRWDVANEDGVIPPVGAIVGTILKDMKKEELGYDESMEELLCSFYADRGLDKWAQIMRDAYRSRFMDEGVRQTQQVEQWIEELKKTARSQGVRGAIDHYLNVLAPKGCERTPAVLRALLRYSTALDDLRLLKDTFNVPLTVDLFHLLVKNNVRTGNLAEALSIYEDSKTAGVIPDAGLVDPLINALCSPPPGSKAPTEENLDRALVIYHELADAVPPSSEPKLDTYEHMKGPDMPIFHSLLRACAVSPQFDKYFPIAKDLLDDMESCNLSKHDSVTASSIIVLFMRRAGSLTDALDAYYGLRSSLDEKGYAIVLNAFCQLSFDNNMLPIPSLTNYFDIVKDMRRAGLEITAEVYTILLKQLGSLPTMYPDVLTNDHIKELVSITRRVHDFLTLDAAVTPDEHVWNQLMNTYQRLGCFGDAYRLWDTMYLTGRFNHVSVSIILDACGYASAWDAAKKVCTQLFRDKFSMNLHNWNTWIECLCRLGRLNDALKAVCLEMGKNGNTVAPDVESARILIKFARRDNMEADVLERLQRYDPELWERLPEDLRGVIG